MIPSKTMRDALGNDMSICPKHTLEFAKENNIPWLILCTGWVGPEFFDRDKNQDVLNRPNNYNWDLSSPRVGPEFSDAFDSDEDLTS